MGGAFPPISRTDWSRSRKTHVGSRFKGLGSRPAGRDPFKGSCRTGTRDRPEVSGVDVTARRKWCELDESTIWNS
jgi:hypothetical protein